MLFFSKKNIDTLYIYYVCQFIHHIYHYFVRNQRCYIHSKKSINNFNNVPYFSLISITRIAHRIPPWKDTSVRVIEARHFIVSFTSDHLYLHFIENNFHHPTSRARIVSRSPTDESDWQSPDSHLYVHFIFDCSPFVA